MDHQEEKHFNGGEMNAKVGATDGINVRQRRRVIGFLFCDISTEPSSFYLSNWLFLRLLGAGYLIAFLSLWSQVHGLVGSEGILPAATYLKQVREILSTSCYWMIPTLCWLSSSDFSLTAMCMGGTILSLCLIVGIAPLPTLFFLWIFYLSLVVVGQVFFSFQWDSLLLETGFISLFIAPGKWWSWPSRQNPPCAIGRWLLWWLLFKLMFLSGMTKLLSGDLMWRTLAALDVHYESQPLPTWIGWYVHQLPHWFHQVSVVLMFVIELGVPFLIFAPRRMRHVGCAALILLQVIIAATGNYCFFNLLTAMLCVLLIDDRLVRLLVPKRWTSWLCLDRPQRTAVLWKRIPVYIAAAIIFVASSVAFVREMVVTHDRNLWKRSFVLNWIGPFRTISGYGLFRVMTTQRCEIVIEGSRDGLSWSEYQLPWQPGNVQCRPGFVQPHQPRLDWQMWFAALNPQGQAHWLVALAHRLLEGSVPVLDLIQTNPFPDKPPQLIRFVYYEYRFTDVETRRATGAWWRRKKIGVLTTRPIALSEVSK